MQPTFLPWLGYFKMIQSVDKFVFLDNVCFECRSWQSRNKIKLNAKEHYLSLSLKKASQNTLIKDIELFDEPKWKSTLLKTFAYAYKKSENFTLLNELLSDELVANTMLSELNIRLIKHFCEFLSLRTSLFKASELNLSPTHKKETLLLEICKHFKADEYLSPQGSKVYLQSEQARALFANNQIQIKYFEYLHPIYRQLSGEFISHLAVVDYLACVPKAKWINF